MLALPIYCVGMRTVIAMIGRGGNGRRRFENNRRKRKTIKLDNNNNKNIKQPMRSVNWNIY